MNRINDRISTFKIFADIRRMIITVTSKRITTNPPASHFDPNVIQMIKMTIKDLKKEFETCPDEWETDNVEFKRKDDKIVIVYRR